MLLNVSATDPLLAAGADRFLYSYCPNTPLTNFIQFSLRLNDVLINNSQRVLSLYIESQNQLALPVYEEVNYEQLVETVFCARY